MFFSVNICKNISCNSINLNLKHSTSKGYFRTFQLILKNWYKYGNIYCTYLLAIAPFINTIAIVLGKSCIFENCILPIWCNVTSFYGPFDIVLTLSQLNFELGLLKPFPNETF